MPIPDTFKIDFEQAYGRDLVAEALSRSLDMWNGKPVYEALLTAFVSEVQEFYDASVQLMKARSLYDSTGVWLDGIADIVGAIRLSIDAGQAYPFLYGAVKNSSGVMQPTTNVYVDDSGTPISPSPATDDSLYYPENTVWWVKNAPVGGLVSPSEGEFKNQVMARILHNLNKSSSVPFVVGVIKTIFDVYVKIETTGPMQIKIWLPDSATNSVAYFLKYLYGDSTCDIKTFIPYPSTIEVTTGYGQIVLKQMSFYSFESSLAAVSPDPEISQVESSYGWSIRIPCTAGIFTPGNEPGLYAPFFAAFTTNGEYTVSCDQTWITFEIREVLANPAEKRVIIRFLTAEENIYIFERVATFTISTRTETETFTITQEANPTPPPV